MNALLKLIPIEKLVFYVLIYLRGITREQWRFALQTVGSLAAVKMENWERWETAKRLLDTFGVTESRARNYLIETALSYIEKGLHK